MDCKINLKDKHPHDEANILSKTFFWWCFPLFYRGHKYSLVLEDLWQARKVDRSDKLGDRLEAEWRKELEKAKKENYQPSLCKAIVACFWFEYMLCGFMVGILFIVLWPMVPYTLALFIDYFSKEKTAETYKFAHIYNFLMNLCIIGTPVMLNNSEFYQCCVGMRVRIACCSLMYRKILKLNRAGLNKTEPGQVVNLMSNDVNRFDLASLYLHNIWIMPIVVPLVCYLVWQKIYWATLSGLAVIILQTLLVQTYLSNLQGNLRGKIATRTDERVKIMSELVSGVQVIKMYAWEKPFEKLVDKLRKYEVKFISQTSMIKGFSTAIMVFTERLVLFSAIITFTLTGGHIESGITFSLVQYFNLLQIACNIYFPWALSTLGEAKVSIRRLEEFLLLDEIASDEAPKAVMNGVKNSVNDHNKESSGLILKGVTASWHPNPIIHTLRNITLTVNPGEFVGIVGSVGSGKSSLLQMILGEMQLSYGKISQGNAKIAYASQEPWLFTATVRQNILFGLPYDKTRYKKVIQSCALARDFEQLPAGDATLVSERGISLSGGQRARIGLARACYREADIYLLDDPLSAVDTRVGKHLVSECVMGLLQNSTRILVTHQLHHLKSADKVIILRNGEIETQGTFEQVSQLPLFNQMLQHTESEDTEESENKTTKKTQNLSAQSHASLNSLMDAVSDEEDEPQESDELIEKGRVSSSVYIKYFRAGGSWLLLTCTVISILLAQTITSTADLWLSHWMNDITRPPVNKNNQSAALNSISRNNDSNISQFSPANETLQPNLTIIGTMMKTALTLGDLETANNYDHTFYIYVWSAAIVGCIILTSGRSLLFMWVCMRSSIKLHNRMFSNILSATMRFFDTNPSGRILNRFSKDMGIVDEILPKMYIEGIQIAMVMVGILVMVAIVNPYMLLTTLVCGVVMYFWTIVYLSTAQAIKRLEGASRSPVFSHVTASMAGLTTVRACGAEEMLCKQFDEKQDVHTATWFLTMITNASFSIWLSLVAAAYVLVVSYTFLLLDNEATKSGNVGLAISQAIILVNMLQYGVKQLTQVVSQMTSVERILQYTKLPQEVSNGTLPPKDWPQHARVIFKDLYLRYDKDSEPVLKNLNIVIDSGWKVGVVGRTGAGKSSLISALFRLAPIDGEVLIDDVDSGTIALKELRSKISIIPQEPVLFSASLRYNLDPFDKYSDADIWKALEQVELKDSITSLSAVVETGGSNFSAGERQLLCLARAALACNRLLVLDEATANVDSNTDALIQKSIRRHFSECTVITVAHRLHTVADSDRIIVMDAGQIVECGHPYELLQNEKGHFSGMVKELGPASEQSLRDLANEAYLGKQQEKSDHPQPAIIDALNKLKA